MKALGFFALCVVLISAFNGAMSYFVFPGELLFAFTWCPLSGVVVGWFAMAYALERWAP